MRVMKNASLMTIVTFFLIDNINIADSQLHILTIMPTPITEKSTFVLILPPTVEDEMNWFIFSDAENHDNDCSETLARSDRQ